MTYLPIPDETEAVAKLIVDSAFQVHKELGPGLLESVYEHCLFEELCYRNLPAQRQVKVPIRYRGKIIDAGLRLDLMVSDLVIVEIKAVESMMPVFDAQLLTYLKLCNKRLGLLINFNVPLIKNGIKRIIL